MKRVLDKKPFFSVIMCAFNRGYILERALKSLIEQSCDDWELIIIDDGSGDNTEDIVAPYLGDKVRYYRLPHRGLAASRNAGIERAKGAYITFLDTDDTYKENHLQVRKDYLMTHPHVDLLHSTVEVIGDAFVPDKDNPEKLIAIADCVVGGTFVIKRTAMDVTDRFHDGYSDDSAFYERFVAKGKKVVKIDSPTYVYYRDSPDSLCFVASQDEKE